MQKAVYRATGTFGTCEVAYLEWGDITNSDVIFCVHGLTRNSRDFDHLANVLSDKYRVISVDVPGRGESQWLDNPADYTYPTYCSIILGLIAHLNIWKLDWIGTSMGGIIGMSIAALPENPIQRLVINDVGPFLPKEALQRINAYLSMNFQFNSVDEVESHLRHVHQPFGPLTDDQWRHMAVNSAKQHTTGEWRLKYDPAISAPFKDLVSDDIAFWEVWDAITCPSLVLRGQESDILLPETAAEMLRRGPKTEINEFTGMGHAPALMADDQISVIAAWLAHNRQD